ncbi:MAG: glycosyltransferase family 2 protein [Armatimonadetes bacterium]|nr:glycosyltransferase family 2 protein [Armatimonadota bacterium]
MLSYKLGVIIPAFNEAENIVQVVGEVREVFPDAEVFVVDDASLDRTAELAREAGAHVLSLPLNLGIGGAVQTGFIAALEAGCDYMVRVDGDGQHPPSEAPKVLAPVLAGEADYAFGSRLVGDETGYRPTAVRAMGIALFAGLAGAATGLKLRDVTSGFLACNRRALAFLSQHLPTFFPEPEAIVWLSKHGFRIAEVGVQMRPRLGGTSSVNWPKALFIMFRVALGMIVTSVRAPVRWKEA